MQTRLLAEVTAIRRPSAPHPERDSALLAPQGWAKSLIMTLPDPVSLFVIGKLTAKPSLLVIAGLALLGMAGCSEPSAAPSEKASAADAAVVQLPAAGAAPAPASAAPAPDAPESSPVKGAPRFVVLYPGAEAKGQPTLANGPAGPGGILDFTTTATPDEVVAFYKQRAEAAGLKTIASMSQSGNAGYSAGDGESGRGQLLSVVATPIDGKTDVQLSWSAGV